MISENNWEIHCVLGERLCLYDALAAVIEEKAINRDFLTEVKRHLVVSLIQYTVCLG